MTDYNKIAFNKHILICLDVDTNKINNKDYEYITSNFCGIVIKKIGDINYDNMQNKIIYLCGDISNTLNLIHKYINNELYVISSLSDNYNISSNKYNIIDIGEVPINIHNVGILYRKLFDSDNDYYKSITTEHTFQKLTESNKPGNAFRKGIYITKVDKTPDDKLKFNLLRCSTNLDGPTDNLRSTDNKILNKINHISQYLFTQKVELNHVLAQIYENTKIVTYYYYFMIFINFIWTFITGKNYFDMNNKNIKPTERKAKISSHSDKTKDMPKNGTMAFCTFYKSYENDKFNDSDLNHIKKSQIDDFDYVYKDISVLTRLYFKLKKNVNDDKLVKEFEVKLYPNSAFYIPLSTNRLYTHEIRPSILPIDKIPIRMGYVIRCSNTKAIYKDNNVYIVDGENYTKLREITDEDRIKIKELYLQENITTNIIDYGKIYVSMNEGDYTKPIF